MKKLMLSMAAFSMLALASCEDKAEETENKETSKKNTEEVVEEMEISVKFNTDESYVWWSGGKKYSDDGHSGKLKMESGSVTVKGGEIIDGSATFDVASIYDTDIDESQGSANLIDHLANSQKPHFFVQDSLGMPTFKVNSYENGIIKGDLTIKGETNKIEIPANVEVMDDKILITSDEFEVDMSQYGMLAWETPEGELTEEQKKSVMDPMVKLKIHVVANR